MLQRLAEERGIRRLTLNGDMTRYVHILANKLIDELRLVVGPTAHQAPPQSADEGASPAVPLTDVGQLNDLVFLRYTINRWNIRKYPGPTT